MPHFEYRTPHSFTSIFLNHIAPASPRGSGLTAAAALNPVWPVFGGSAGRGLETIHLLTGRLQPMSEPTDESVTLVDYDASWPRAFVNEARRLENADLPGFLGVEHIGSTAVPGLSAKPIIDIMLTVTIPARSRKLVRELEALGYRYLGNFGLRGRHFFRLGEPARVHLHVVHNRSPHARAWLEFRDTLRTHPEWLAYYEREKKELARTFRCDRAAYTAAKGPIVATILNATHRPKEPWPPLD